MSWGNSVTDRLAHSTISTHLPHAWRGAGGWGPGNDPAARGNSDTQSAGCVRAGVGGSEVRWMDEELAGPGGHRTVSVVVGGCGEQHAGKAGRNRIAGVCADTCLSPSLRGTGAGGAPAACLRRPPCWPGLAHSSAQPACRSFPGPGGPCAAPSASAHLLPEPGWLFALDIL